MRTDVIVDIVYSAFIQDYFAYFILLVLGYFVLVKFLGYVIGNIPFIKKIFFNNKLMSLLIWIPLLLGIYKVVFNIDNADYFLEYNLFIIIFISISIFVFIYSGTKQVYSDFTLVLFLKSFKASILIVLLVSFFYTKNYFGENYNFIKSELRNEVYMGLRNIKVNNDSLYYLAKTMANHFIKTTNQQIRTIDYEKENILASFDEKIKSYDNKYENLAQLINESRTVIKSIEKRYETKIDIVDSEIDNKKLKLDSIYKEWVNNVENNIENLDQLVKESKEKMQLLNNNKKLMSEFRDDLNLLDKKLFDISTSLISEKEKNLVNNNVINDERKKSLEKFIILQEDIRIYQNNFNVLEKDMNLIKEDIKQKNVEILNIKNTMVKKSVKIEDKNKVSINSIKKEDEHKLVN